MNTELLLQIAEKAIKFPATMDMNWFGETVAKDDDHPCGAVACIAGTAILLTSARSFRRLARDGCVGDWFHKAAKILGLNNAQAERLFYPDRPLCELRVWPRKRWLSYKEARTYKARARVVYNRILHFIKTNGEE